MGASGCVVKMDFPKQHRALEPGSSRGELKPKVGGGRGRWGNCQYLAPTL